MTYRSRSIFELSRDAEIGIEYPGNRMAVILVARITICGIQILTMQSLIAVSRVIADKFGQPSLNLFKSSGKYGGLHIKNSMDLYHILGT
jgi:hypothetical protein